MGHCQQCLGSDVKEVSGGDFLPFVGLAVEKYWKDVWIEGPLEFGAAIVFDFLADPFVDIGILGVNLFGLTLRKIEYSYSCIR